MMPEENPVAAPSTEPIMQFFRFDHLPEKLQAVSRPFGEIADRVMHLPRNPERTVALRKLLEAKDAAVRALICLTVLLLALPAFADAPAASAAPSAFSGFLATYVYPALITIAGTVVTALAALLARFVASMAKGTIFEHTVDVATEAARSAVAHVDAELKPKLVAAMAPDSDGGATITPAEAAQLKAAATELFFKTIAPESLAKLKTFFGGDLGTFVSGLLERALTSQKAARAASSPPAP